MHVFSGVVPLVWDKRVLANGALALHMTRAPAHTFTPCRRGLARELPTLPHPHSLPPCRRLPPRLEARKLAAGREGEPEDL